MNTSQVTQRNDMTDKYSGEPEFGFWRVFSQTGLMEYEMQAVKNWITPNSRILDVGCGCGREALVLSRLGHMVCAVDVVPRMVEATRRHSQEEQLPVWPVLGDVCDGIPFRGAFDAAVLLEQVYQQIPRKEARIRALRKISECLLPGGVILLSAFNEGDIDLVARLRWLQEGDWSLARSIQLDGTNPLSSRYLSKGENLRCRRYPHRYSEHLSVRRWIVAYLWHLLKRKLKRRIRRTCFWKDDSSQCKRISRTNPLTHSEGSFLLPILAFHELENELIQAGLEICDISALLESEGGFSARAKRGSPLYTIVARRSPS